MLLTWLAAGKCCYTPCTEELSHPSMVYVGLVFAGWSAAAFISCYAAAESQPRTKAISAMSTIDSPPHEGRRTLLS